MAAKKRSAPRSPAARRAAAGKRKPAAKKAAPAVRGKTPARGAGKSTPARPAARNQATTTVAAKAVASRGAPAKHSQNAATPSRLATPRRSAGGPLTSSVGLIHGIPPYQAKAGEPYMNDHQLAHFRNILLAWKRELMEEVDRTVHHMQDEASNFPDPNDRATQESEFGLELRTRDRERKLLKKIDSALARIEDGSYGYCEETGEEIGLKRLEARPVATLSVEAQERRELAERQFRDREDGF